jgi:cytochrome P450
MGGIHITMRSTAVWDDPGTFDPDRFLPERVDARAPGSYVPHGHGPRAGHKCPAEDMVAVTVKLFLTLLMRRNLTWELPQQDLTFTNELFPIPVSGLDVKFKPYSAKSGNIARPSEGLARR